MRSEELRRRTEEITTTTHKVLGKPISETVVKVEKLEYVNVEEEGLKEGVKKAMEMIRFSEEEKPFVETFASTIYADVIKTLDEKSGDITYAMQKAGYRVEINEPASGAGIFLKDKGIKWKRLLEVVKLAFVGPQGEQNPVFKQMLEDLVKQRMGIVEERKEPPKDETF